MTTVAPLSLFGIFKAISTVLFALTLVWIAISLAAFQNVVASQFLAGLILLIAAGVGPLVYLRFQHLKLQYDAHGFALFAGKNKVAAGQWQHFNRVSLFHRGHAMFAVRLYTPEKIYIDIPVSELKLNPDQFRRFATEMVKQNVTGGT